MQNKRFSSVGFLKENDSTDLEAFSNCTNLDSRSTAVHLSSQKPLVIICSGNGASYEYFHRFDYWIEFYLSAGYHVCLWNYRGYGLSEGFPTFCNLKSDSEVLFDQLKLRHKYTKIVVHGISIGGIAACHLAGNRQIEILVADRTFSSIYEVISSIFPHGRWISKFYKAMRCFSEDSNNLKSLLMNHSNIKRIFIADRNDKLVTEEASLVLRYTEHLLYKSIGSCSKLDQILLNSEESKIIQGFAQLNKYYIQNDSKGYEPMGHCNTNSSLGPSTRKNVLKEEMIEEVSLQSAAFNQVLIEIKSALKPYLFGNLDSHEFRFEKIINSAKLILVWGIRDSSQRLSNMCNAQVSVKYEN